MLTDRAESASAFHLAQLVADGHRPALDAGLATTLADGDQISGWHCLMRGVGASLTIGTLPLPVSQDDVVIERLALGLERAGLEAKAVLDEHVELATPFLAPEELRDGGVVLLIGQDHARENGLYDATPVVERPGYVTLTRAASMAAGTALAPGDTVKVADGGAYVVRSVGTTAATTILVTLAAPTGAPRKNRHERRADEARKRRAKR